MRTILGSVLFQVLFYINTAFVTLFLCVTIFFLPKKWGHAMVRYWGHAALFLMRVCCGLKTEFVNVENMPQSGALIASKHQSYWDIFATLAVTPNPCFVSKKELLDIPLFGFAAKRYDVIGIDRSKGRDAMALLSIDAVKRLKNGRNVILFPEGTRRPVGAEPKYKSGVVRLYDKTQCPLVPVGVHSAPFWPKKQFFIKPGVARLVVGKPIEPGLTPKIAQQRMIDDIEALSEQARQG